MNFKHVILTKWLYLIYTFQIQKITISLYDILQKFRYYKAHII